MFSETCGKPFCPRPPCHLSIFFLHFLHFFFRACFRSANPSGSVKDRLAKTIIDDAEGRGELHPDSHILECSSGNTGVAFSMLGAARGYKVTI
ncbi:MAG: pyridoxal-phosphate dependent enzyme, partial [Opitutales bacterium]